MAKFELRIQARDLRKQGVSVKTIAKQLGVSKGTASIWVRDIILTVEQLEALRQSSIIGSERGRLKSALLKKEQRLKRFEDGKILGKETIGKLTDRELLIAGIALYWAEGCKKTQRFELCNSDPKMIQFFLHWLRTCLSVENQDIKCCVGINIAHETREQIVKDYWSKLTGLPLTQFTKTSFKYVQNKKIYDNFDEHYGVLAIRVAKPGRFYFKILGLIEALSGIVNVNNLLG